ncbi:MAG: DUF6586 family protein [Pseudomonadales bacterium]
MRNQTNEKLSRVKLLLVPLQAASDSNLVDALAEAVLLELGLAYRCFLSELAEAHGLAPQPLSSATELSAALAAQQTFVAEVAELTNLECDRSWPHVLLIATHARSHTATGAVSAKDKKNLINVLQLDEIVNNNLSYSNCFEIYQALRTCVQHQRDMAQEW